MPNDIIETFVAVDQRDGFSLTKEFKAAKYIQRDGDLQFSAVLPLESEPKLDELTHMVKQVGRCVMQIEQNFVRAGYFLNRIRTEGLYRYPIEEGLQGYTSFYVFCEKELHISRTTARRLVEINEKFCKNAPELPGGYRRFTSSQLSEMSEYKNGLEGKLTPDVTCKQIKKLKKYYSSRDWEVDITTSWREDLKTYEEQSAWERRRKSRYLHGKSFESVTESQSTSEKRAPEIKTMKYGLYINFCEKMKEQLRELRKTSKFTYGLSELEKQLTTMLSEAERAQSSDLFSE